MFIIISDWMNSLERILMVLTMSLISSLDFGKEEPVSYCLELLLVDDPYLQIPVSKIDLTLFCLTMSLLTEVDNTLSRHP